MRDDRKFLQAPDFNQANSKKAHQAAVSKQPRNQQTSFSKGKKMKLKNGILDSVDNEVSY